MIAVRRCARVVWHLLSVCFILGSRKRVAQTLEFELGMGESGINYSRLVRYGFFCLGSRSGSYRLVWWSLSALGREGTSSTDDVLVPTIELTLHFTHL